MPRGDKRRSVVPGGAFHRAIRSLSKTTLSLELSQETRQRLEALRDRSSPATFVDVIKKALHLYDIALTHQQSGGEIILRDSTGAETSVEIV